MALRAQNKIIHRFIRPISDYEEGGEFYTQIIPLDTQAYALYPIGGEKAGLYYVFGDGNHTYDEIRKGKSELESAREYAVFNENTGYSKEQIDAMFAAIHQFNILILPELPEVGIPYTLYLIEKEEYESEDNQYDKYLWVEDHFEFFGGSDEVSAANVTYTENNCTNAKQALDKLFLKTAEYIYNHTAEASAVWTIQHNLNKIPQVLVLDSANNILEGCIKYIDENNIQIKFYSGTQVNLETGMIEQKPIAVSGKAYLH